MNIENESVKNVQVGGAKQRNSQKQRRTQQKKGGAVMDDIKNLAVPFAILLAKQGLEGLFNNKTTKEVGVSASPKKTVKSAKPSARKQQEQEQKNEQQKNKQQKGGACATCQGAAVVGGGKKESNRPSLKKNYVSLAKKIDEFLSKY